MTSAAVVETWFAGKSEQYSCKEPTDTWKINKSSGWGGCGGWMSLFLGLK